MQYSFLENEKGCWYDLHKLKVMEHCRDGWNRRTVRMNIPPQKKAQSQHQQELHYVMFATFSAVDVRIIMFPGTIYSS